MTLDQNNAAHDHVTILLALYNGAAHLDAQLRSLADQTHTNWSVLASDDGSTDATQTLVETWAQDHAARLVTGPKAGFSANFMSLLGSNAIDKNSFVALCDQDDVWQQDKLAMAMVALRGLDPAQPALYCSRRMNWNPDTNQKQMSRAYPLAASFQNALIENIAPGNTIVLNPAAAQLVRQAVPKTSSVFAHDWWLYLLISGAGGQIIWDETPTVLYRQHEHNVIGAGEGLLRSFLNKMNLLGGLFATRVDGNLAALRAAGDILSPENKALLAAFDEARAAPLIQRLRLMRRLGLYRHSKLSTLMFWGAVCLGKV